MYKIQSLCILFRFRILGYLFVSHGHTPRSLCSPLALARHKQREKKDRPPSTRPLGRVRRRSPYKYKYKYIHMQCSARQDRGRLVNSLLHAPLVPGTWYLVLWYSSTSTRDTHEKMQNSTKLVEGRVVGVLLGDINILETGAGQVYDFCCVVLCAWCEIAIQASLVDGR